MLSIAVLTDVVIMKREVFYVPMYLTPELMNTRMAWDWCRMADAREGACGLGPDKV